LKHQLGQFGKNGTIPLADQSFSVRAPQQLRRYLSEFELILLAAHCTSEAAEYLSSRFLSTPPKGDSSIGDITRNTGGKLGHKDNALWF
jgi:hypothetical protein